MAITYFAFTAAPADQPELSNAAANKCIGMIRCWNAGPPRTSSAKWIAVGEDLLIGDHAGLRSITTARKNAIINAMTTRMGLSHAALAEYGRALGRSFHVDIDLPTATVTAL